MDNKRVINVLTHWKQGGGCPRHEVDLIIKELKDNPMPSINKEQLIKDINHVCAWYQGRNVDACERVETYAKLLQNNVKTDKEEPKNEDGYTMVRCIVCGKYHTPICSDNCACALL